MNKFQKLLIVVFFAFIGYLAYDHYKPINKDTSASPGSYPDKVTAEQWISNCAQVSQEWAVDRFDLDIGIKAWTPFCECIVDLFDMDTNKTMTKDDYERICLLLTNDLYDKVQKAKAKKGHK